MFSCATVFMAGDVAHDHDAVVRVRDVIGDVLAVRRDLDLVELRQGAVSLERRGGGWRNKKRQNAQNPEEPHRTPHPTQPQISRPFCRRVGAGGHARGASWAL